MVEAVHRDGFMKSPKSIGNKEKREKYIAISKLFPLFMRILLSEQVPRLENEPGLEVMRQSAIMY